MRCPDCQHLNPDETKFCGNCGNPLSDEHGLWVSPTATYETPKDELASGSLLADRYQVIEELGKGGMGRVYKVLDKEINEKIALKLIKPEIANEKKNLERFRNELKIALQITHKNVCRMYHFGEDQGLYFITMEYVPGEDLKSTIRRIGQLPINKSIAIAKQVCEGLFDAHRLGIIHRDLKPRNIMIDKFGNAKIMDFGIARALKTKSITKEGMAVGTPKYMSPEQLKGEKTDQRSDIYSIGVTLFEMVTGRVPFEGDSSLVIAVKHKTEPPPNPRDLNFQVPEQLSLLILKCLEKEKEKRYQTTAELCEALGKIEEDISSQNKIYTDREKKDETRTGRSWSSILPRISLVILVGIIVFILLDRTLSKKDILSGGEDQIMWKTSIAVLPLEDKSELKDQQLLCDGLTEDIIRNLAKIEELIVRPHYSVREYSLTEKNPDVIGKELDVKTVFSAGLFIEENIIRIQGNLYDVFQNYIIHPFDNNYDLNNILNIQGDISKIIAEKLRISLSQSQLNSMKQGMTENWIAYNHFIRGISYEKEYDDYEKQSDGEEAVVFFNKAIDEDSRFALAYWHRGNVYHGMFTVQQKRSDFEMMRESYEAAYSLDRNLAEANAGLGWVSFYEENLDTAYDYYRRAVELDPNNIDINYHVAGFLKDIGLYTQAVRYYSRALEIDPKNTEFHILSARCYMNNGDFQKAEVILRTALEIEPNSANLRLFLARQLLMMKRQDEAEDQIVWVLGMDPNYPGVKYTRALIYASQGKREQALSIIKGLDEDKFTFLITSVYALLSMNDEALENLTKVIGDGFDRIQTYPYCYPVLKTNPFLDNLRVDPRFIRILGEAEKKHKAMLKQYGSF
ncbi:protein kinase [Acidobacteriota bacterium]